MYIATVSHPRPYDRHDDDDCNESEGCPD